MRSTSAPTSRGLRVLGLALVLLGFCVFAWGLRYKLSLYQPPRVTHSMPEAKLLSSRERTQVSSLDLRQAASLGAPLLGCTMVLALFARMDARARLRLVWAFTDVFGTASPPGDPVPFSCSNRPPPRLL